MNWSSVWQPVREGWVDVDVDWHGDNQVTWSVQAGVLLLGTLLASLIVEASLIHVIKSERLVSLTVLIRMWVIKGRTGPDRTGRLLLSLSVFFFLTFLAILLPLSIFIFFLISQSPHKRSIHPWLLFPYWFSFIIWGILPFYGVTTLVAEGVLVFQVLLPKSLQYLKPPPSIFCEIWLFLACIPFKHVWYPVIPHGAVCGAVCGLCQYLAMLCHIWQFLMSCHSSFSYPVQLS